MKRFAGWIFILLIFSTVFSFSLSAETFQSVKSSYGEWIFTTKSTDGADYENLYAQKTGSSEKPTLILENPAKFPGLFSNLCYVPETESLYFSIHNGGEFVNGVQLFRGEGIYVLKKDADGNYSPKGLRRYTKLEPWLVERAKKAYFDNLPSPDYQGFLDFLFGFADFDVKPCLSCKSESGENLLNEEALRYLHQSSLLDQLVSKEKENYHSGIEDFLFCLDESGRVTEKAAVTANHSQLFYRDGSSFANFHYFLSYKGHIFMLDSRGSMRGSEWVLDFSKIYTISDSGRDFSVYQPYDFNGIMAEVFETPFPKRLDSAPLFIQDGKLYLRDINHTDFYVFENDSFKKVASIEERNSLSGLILSLLFALCLILLALSAFFFFRLRKINSPRFVFALQQQVRSEISSAIHDSVVQDIRALRLDVERLKVQEESEDLQKEAVKNLTECIKRMRDICYGLNPAEIAVAELRDSKVDIISVVQTLCEQFSLRTKIQFQFDIEENFPQISIKNENAKYITRIVMEILSNIEKHSFASSLTLLVREKEIPREGKSVTFIFIDDGVGCEMKSISRKTHFGIRNMMQYARLAGLKIEFLTEKNEGMQVKLTMKEEE